jgi:DNA repair exonuclease SbcCD ATPase subunit
MTSNKKLGDTMQRVLNLIRDRGPIGDKELCDLIDLPDGAIRPARLRLYRRGLVEPDGAGGWTIVPAERIEEVRQQAQAKPPRTRKLSDWTVDERIAAVVSLLGDDEVNQRLIHQTEQGREWRRARARARAVQGEREHERRERRAEAAQAEKEKSVYVDFLKAKNHLKDAIEVVLGVHRFLREDIARYESGEGVRIPPAAWPDVLRNVGELLDVTGALHLEVHKALGEQSERCPLCGTEMAPDVIDAEVVSELIELTGGG